MTDAAPPNDEEQIRSEKDLGGPEDTIAGPADGEAPSTGDDSETDDD